MAKKDKVVKRNDGVNGTYSKETLDNGSTIELLSRRNPNESVTYTERFITPQQDTSYYIYNNTTPDMDRHVIGGKYVTPTKYNKMGWLGKRIIAGVRPDSWDAKFDSYQEPVDSFQLGGTTARMGIQPKEEFTEDEKQALSNGTFYEETTYPDGYHVTRLSSGTKGENQRFPFIYSKMVAPDGSVLYQQDQYRNYPLINKSPKVININDVSYNLGDGEAWFNKYKSIIDGKNLNSPRTKTNRENDLLEYQQGGSVLKAWGGKKLSEQISDEDAQALRSGTYRKSYTDEFGNKIEAKPVVWKNGSLGHGIAYRAITPQNDTLYNTIGFDLEPSDAPGYQTIVPWGGEYVHSYDDDSSHWERSEAELSKRLSVPDVRQKYRPVGNEAPMPNMQEGGEIPSNDQQQQLFVAIITDMAKTLGVEPSQELAEAVITAFENNDDSQGLLTLFTKTKDKFMNETGLFREGGKMIAFVEKFKCGGKSPKKKTSKKQEGGEVEGEGTGYLTTPVNDRQMRRNWREATGGTRREARQAQRNLTNYIENQGGISHGGARNAAAAMMGDPQRFATPIQTPTLKPMDQAQINIPTPTLNAPQDIADMNYDHLGFSQAFGRARGNGVNTFTWRGKEYTTDLAQPSGPANPPSTLGGPSTGHGSRIGNWLDDQRARRNARKADPNRRSFLQQLWNPHPDPLPTHDRRASASEMVDDFLNTHSPRAKARQ